MLRSASTPDSEREAAVLLFPGGGPAPQRQVSPTEIFNAPLVSALTPGTEADLFTYHGHPCRIPLLPWQAGANLFRIEYAIPAALEALEAAEKAKDTKAAEEALRTLANELEALLTYVWRHTRPRWTWSPRHWWWTLRYRWRNPFAEASLGECMVLLGFFCGCRTKHSGVALAS